MINEKKVKRFCKDYTKIENYKEAVKDTTQTWHCHHILGEILTRQQLQDHDFYYDVPPCMLKFVTGVEHGRLHKKGRTSTFKGHSHTAETKHKMSAAMKGENNHNYGTHLTEETRTKLSAAMKGKYTGMTWKVIDGKRIWLPKECK